MFSDGEYFMQSDGNNIKGIYKLNKNSSSKNLHEDNAEEWKTIDTKFKAILQQYNNRMINNKLYYIK